MDTPMHHARARLAGALLAGLLACTPQFALAAVYKCEHNGQVTYSDTPCGKDQQKVQPQVVRVPSSQPPAAPAQQPASAQGVLSTLGLDSRSGLITALLFGIPLSIILIFFLTRKSER